MREVGCAEADAVVREWFQEGVRGAREALGVPGRRWGCQGGVGGAAVSEGEGSALRKDLPSYLRRMACAEVARSTTTATCVKRPL